MIDLQKYCETVNKIIDIMDMFNFIDRSALLRMSKEIDKGISISSNLGALDGCRRGVRFSL